MFDIGFSELLLFGVLALIVLGPEKLPKAARTAGQWYAKLRRAASTIQSEIEAELDLAETRQQMQEELAKIRQTEADMKREIAEMRGSIKDFESSQNESLNADLNPDSNADSETGQQTIDNFSYAYEQDEKDPIAEVDVIKKPSDIADTRNQTSPPITTKPWENMWFRLGAYDKARRLPAPPYLPNYKADTLLTSNFSNPDLDAKMRPILSEDEPSQTASLDKQEADK